MVVNAFQRRRHIPAGCRAQPRPAPAEPERLDPLAFARTPVATDQSVITPLAKRGRRPKRHAPHSSGGTRYADGSGPKVTDQAQRATTPA